LLLEAVGEAHGLLYLAEGLPPWSVLQHLHDKLINDLLIVFHRRQQDSRDMVAPKNQIRHRELLKKGAPERMPGPSRVKFILHA